MKFGQYLPDRDSYVVDTSEFEAMKARLIALDGGMRIPAERVASGRSCASPTQYCGRRRDPDPSVCA